MRFALLCYNNLTCVLASLNLWENKQTYFVHLLLTCVRAESPCRTPSYLSAFFSFLPCMPAYGCPPLRRRPLTLASLLFTRNYCQLKIIDLCFQCIHSCHSIFSSSFSCMVEIFSTFALFSFSFAFVFTCAEAAQFHSLVGTLFAKNTSQLI